MSENRSHTLGLYSLACDRGCFLQLFSTPGTLPGLVEAFEVIHFPFAGHTSPTVPSIALIEGAVSESAHVELIERLRMDAATIVAVGTCAITGGIPSLRNGADERTTDRPIRGIVDVITVEAVLPGCPVDPSHLSELLGSLALGTTPETTEYSVCFECRLRENVCLLEDGRPCLGHLTRGGCGALCPSRASDCIGCRGMLQDPQFTALATAGLPDSLEPRGLIDRAQLFNWERHHELGL